MSDLPIYSPSETDDYLICPRYRVLKKEWEPRGATWQPHMALGNAIHAGLATHYNVDAHLHDNCLADAHMVMVNEYEDGSEWTLEGLQKLVAKGLTEALKTELVSPEGQVLGVEAKIGRCRLDLLTREPFGLVVTDHKVKLSLEQRKMEYTIRDLDPSWQLLQYAWATRELFGECPKWSRAHIIAIGPRAFTHIHSIGPLDDERLDDFARSGAVYWEQMHSDAFYRERNPHYLPPMNTRSCWRYGRKCEFYDGCHLYAGDLSKFPTIYEKKEAR